jgi:threonyl-tRNA synthetase
MNLEHLRHSLAHLLAAAVMDLYPDTKRAIGPAIENGFYYDFELPEKISDENLPKIEKRMRDILKHWKTFTHREVSADEARELFKGNPYKLELIDEIASKGEKITIYTSGEGSQSPYDDLCRGGHIENAKDIDPKAFKLTHLAGAYWRGDEKKAQLTRIYGLAFATPEELEQHITMMEEAKKRDHKKLGVDLDLFTFSELIGSGLPLFTPRGTLIRNLLDSYVWSLRSKHGYQQVDVPHITKKDLYEKSGHWDKFKDELFKIETREGHIFAMKPMNCPHHTQIYARKQHSYRDLPQRFANTTKVYRDEQSGELAGLSRVRSITQDDAHVFCRHSQIKEEIFKIWDIISTFYGTFGFELQVRLSLHDPAHMEKYLGTPEIWQNAEDSLRTLVKERGVQAIEGIGEAALYGPKLDFLGKDALGREHQVATIQLDMNLPERFELYCVNEKGEHERIVMIHAAIMGSIERFMSVIIEHFGGAFPAWLAPVQVAVLPISEKVMDGAQKITDQLKEAGIRVELSMENESIGKKIRNAEMMKVPYLLVIGEKELEAGKVAVRQRGKGDLGQMDLSDFLAQLKETITSKSL